MSRHSVPAARTQFVGVASESTGNEPMYMCLEAPFPSDVHAIATVARKLQLLILWTYERDGREFHDPSAAWSRKSAGFISRRKIHPKGSTSSVCCYGVHRMRGTDTAFPRDHLSSLFPTHRVVCRHSGKADYCLAIDATLLPTTFIGCSFHRGQLQRVSVGTV